jgi:hypothetical protein
VTTKNANGNTINGKYSLAVSDKLLGENYPFPTILTQETGSGSQRTTVNVHYGDWPISGIERENGGLPVDIDLFADYDSQAQSAVAIERLTLSSLVSKKNGKLTVTVENSGTDADASDTPVAEAAFAAGDDFTDGSAELFITGLRAGYAKVTVTYTTSDAVYTTTIDVQVTAQLYMMSTTVPVIAFTNETAEAQLEMKDSQGVALPDELKEKIDILSCNVEADMNYLDVAMAQLVMDETTGKFVPGMAQLVLDTAGQTGETQLNVTYIYSYLGQEYTATTPVALQIQSLKVEFEPLHIYLDGKTEATMIYTSDQVQIRVGEDEELASDVQMIDFENSEDRNIVFAEWQDNKKQALRISGYSTDTDSGSAYLKLQVQFTYGGSKHTLWGYLGVIVHNGAEEDSDDNETETEINVLPVSPGNQETESQTEIESETEKSETQDGDGV